MTRDSDLVKLRPIVDFNSDNLKKAESFQNKTLRPILKFQNQYILYNFKNYIKTKEPLFNAYSALEQKKIIRKSVKEDQRLKNHLLSSMIAYFAIEELEFYTENSKEISKRIVSMIIQRVEDQISTLY